MNTTQLEYFLVLADKLNYSIAAEELGISQPTLSKAMRHLESELNFPLFEKIGRHITLTPKAQTFIPYVKQSIQALDQGLALVHNEPLRIGSIFSIQTDYLPSVLEEYRQYDQNFQFNITSGVSRELIKALKNREIDVAICSVIEDEPQLIITDIIEQPLLLCVPMGHRLAKKKTVTIHDFKDEKLISHNRDGSMHQTVKAIYDHHGIQPTIVAEAQEDNTIVSFVKANIGVGIVCQSKSLIADGVALIPIEQDIVHKTTSVITRRSDIHQHQFVHFLRQKHL